MKKITIKKFLFQIMVRRIIVKTRIVAIKIARVTINKSTNHYIKYEKPQI